MAFPRTLPDMNRVRSSGESNDDEDQVTCSLALEFTLQRICAELLERYKSTKDWRAVAQLAHALADSAERVDSREGAAEALCVCARTDQAATQRPTTPILGGGKSSSLPSPRHVVAVLPGKTDDCFNLLTSFKSVLRTKEDFSILRTRLNLEESLIQESLEKDSNQDPTSLTEGLQNYLVAALADSVTQSDPLLTCFLSDRVHDFAKAALEKGDTAVVDAQLTMEDPLATNPISEPSEPHANSNHVSPSPMTSETPPNILKPSEQLSNGDLENSIEDAATSVESNGGVPQDSEPREEGSDHKLASSTEPNQATENSNGSLPNGGSQQTVAQSDSSCVAAPSSGLAPIGEVENETDESSAFDRSGSVTEPPSCESSSSVNSSPVATGQLKVNSPKNKRAMKTRSTSFFESSLSSVAGIKKSFSLRKKHSTLKPKVQRADTQFDGTVSLAAPELTTNWDPTCLLEELYQDHRSVVTQSSMTGENSRHAGYLDKLPVNQRKPTVMKGWKTRFFRLTRGSLFYYDDEVSMKATSFIRLTDSKIVMDSNSLKLEIVEKGSGNFIILRAENQDDMIEWHRALQLESVHPTMTHRMSLSPPNSSPTLIIDLGSCSVRAGIATDNAYPQMFFPTVCAEDNDTGEVLACGLDALLPSVRNHCRLVYPRRTKIRMDSNDSVRPYYQAIIEKVAQTLHVEPGNSSVIFSVSSAMPESQKQDLVEVCLELFGFRGILIQEQSVLALYSYSCTSGIVINAGDTIDVVPVIDGYKVDAGSSHVPYCGHLITENLSKFATEKDIRYFSGIEMYIIRFIKENICFVSPNYEEDSEQCEENAATYIRAVELDRFNLPDHRKVIHLDSALFKAPEGLFSPGKFGKDVLGIHELVVKAIDQCPMDMRREMARRIYLSGGTTLMVGFPERLEVELRQLLMPRSEVQVHGSENRQHAAYIGASVLASLASFEKSLISLEDWSENGLNALNKNTI